MINPGKYDKKVDFLRHSVGQDDYGDPIDEWVTFKANKWASKDPLLGNEYFASLTNDTKVEVKFNTRYMAGITNEMRIKHGNEIYEILSAIDVKSQHKEILCYCKLVK